jgi:hypothetical protein
MQEKISAFRQHVIEESGNPAFVHHKWFVKWHLEIVQRIAAELCEYYPDADRDLVEMMALNRGKLTKDWDHKIVLPEARKAFEERHRFHLEQAGKLPAKFI